ncbi:RHS repeat-associated core domain-containing protein [Brevibacillus laterosporus]|uniref:RHS repeat-associated core domain-containing protein n=1 Tax=Brevibacillus laterosporus TaxID=1465 RepID=UPI002E1AFB04|nr:RHS repeat-associated core domain-containing protein [Brevibacillus laterosporus]
MNGSAVVVWYSYDKAGNVTEIGTVETTPKKAMGFGKDNRLSHVNEQPVEKDADGNLLTWTENEETHTYAYDARNRLVRTGQAHYTYDAENLRTSMTWKGKTTRYVVDQVEVFSRVLMELGEDGSPKAYYVYGQGLIGREDAQGNYLSYHMDMRGSTTMLSDCSGRVTDRYSYGVYGELEQHDGTTSQPFCYNGRDGVITDPNGLYYMRARYYHPGVKRFLNRDILPGDVTEGQTFNRFAYVNGDPVGFIDPLGLAGLGTGQCKKGKVKRSGDADNPIRAYRGKDLSEIDPIYIADKRTVVEMPFVGRGEKYTNSEGWKRDRKYFWNELLERHPKAFDPSNRAIIEGRNPFTDSPVNNETFRKYFPQYDMKGIRGDKLIHHHIGGGGQAFPVPQTLHPGSGGIHNIEKKAGIWGNDKMYAELLQRLLKK